MNFIESIKMAFTSLTVNKMRSFLTMLGIIIGISAVITITTIGNSIQETLNNTFNSLGVSEHQIYLQPKGGEYTDDLVMDDGDMITLEMLNGLVEEHPDELMLDLGDDYGMASIVNEEGDSFQASLRGVTDNYFDSLKKYIVKGRPMTKGDCQKHKHTCMISDVFAEQYFKDPNDIIGKTIRFEMDSGEVERFTVVGLMELTELEKQQMGFNQVRNELEKVTTVFIPYDTMMELQGIEPKEKTMTYALIAWTNKCDSETAKTYIKDYFDDAYSSNEDWQVEIYDMQDDLGLINTVLTVITVAISVIAAISLIVGGVGVMNIMLVSILERTREIGVRKALGALNNDIRRQFVIEAIIICLTGGLIGVVIGILNGSLLGIVASSLINSNFAEYAEFISLTVRPSIPAIIISLSFSMLTGLIFGYYPAKRAANMNPIDALRYE